jgi:hypothetical protein
MPHAGAAFPPAGGNRAWLCFPGSLVVALSTCLFVAPTAAKAQFKELGPPPVTATVAREQVRTLLEKANAGNRQQTVAAISGLLAWYRDLIDEELIAAWKGNARANLPDTIESLADPHVAEAIVNSHGAGSGRPLSSQPTHRCSSI